MHHLAVVGVGKPPRYCHPLNQKPTDMLEVMIALAKGMPEELLLDYLQKALTEYRSDPTPQKRSLLGMYCQLLCTRDITDGESIEQVITRFNQDSNP